MRESKEKIIGDSSLKSLVHQTVYESRGINNREERANSIHKGMKAMLPNYTIVAMVIDRTVACQPYIAGNHKGSV